MNTLIWRPRYKNHPTAASGFLLDRWLRQYPDSKPDDTDYEEWVENVSRLYWAEKTDAPVVILPMPDSWVHVNGEISTLAQGNGPTAVFLGDYHAIDAFQPAAPYRFIGPGAKRLPPYWKSETFLSRAGRKIEIAADSTVIRAQTEPVFIKTIKKGWSQIHHPGDELDWYGEQDLLMQGLIEPEYEYRFLVVEGTREFGAGVVWEHTPLDNCEFDFHPVARKKITEPESQPENIGFRLLKYLDFAKDFARAFEAENGPHSYTLDVCTHHGEVLPIELNPMTNFGLYAMNVPALMNLFAHLQESRNQRNGVETT